MVGRQVDVISSEKSWLWSSANLQHHTTFSWKQKMGMWIVCSRLPKHSMQYKNCTNSSIKHAPEVCSFGRVFMSNTVWHCWGLHNYHRYPQIFLCPRTHVLAASCCSPFRHVHRSHTQWDPLIRACSCSVIGHLPVAYHVCKSSYPVIIPMKRPLLPLWQIGTYQQTDLPPEQLSRAPNPAQEKKSRPAMDRSCLSRLWEQLELRR